MQTSHSKKKLVVRHIDGKMVEISDGSPHQAQAWQVRTQPILLYSDGIL